MTNDNDTLYYDTLYLCVATENARLVFEDLCRSSCNWNDCYVFPARCIAETTKLSVYKVRKALHELQELGFVKRDSQGCPAVVSYGEVAELVEDAAPPINGWSVTETGRRTDIYKQAYKDYCKSLEDWANGTL